MNIYVARTTDSRQVIERIRTALIERHDVMGYQLPFRRATDSAGVPVTLQDLRPQSAPSESPQRARPAALPVVVVLTTNLGYHFRRPWHAASFGCTLGYTFRCNHLAQSRIAYLLACFLRVDTLSQLVLRFLAHRYTLVPRGTPLLRFAHFALRFFRVRLVVPPSWRHLIPKWVAVMLPSLKVHDAEPVRVSPAVATLDCAFLFWFSHVLILTHKLNYCNGIAISYTETLTRGDE